MRFTIRVYRRLIHYGEIILRKLNINTYLPNFIYDAFHLMAEKDICKNLKGFSINEEQIEKNLTFKPVIWVMWWQSEDIPHLVKDNIRRMKQNSDYPVIVLNEKNIGKYLNISPTILKNVRDEKVGLATFADYIRSALLYKYGGIWLDSTIYVANKIPNIFKDNAFFTIKGVKPSVHKFVSKGRWSVYVLGAEPGKEYFKFTRDALKYYIENNIKLTDYFMLDYLLDLSYKENIGNFKNDIEKVEINNINVEVLSGLMNQPFDSRQFNKLKEGTYLFKLSNKKQYFSKKNGTTTFYGNLYRGKG